jgi:hypothetical protein
MFRNALSCVGVVVVLLVVGCGEDQRPVSNAESEVKEALSEKARTPMLDPVTGKPCRDVMGELIYE